MTQLAMNVKRDSAARFCVYAPCTVSDVHKTPVFISSAPCHLRLPDHFTLPAGHYLTEEEAARAYDRAALLQQGPSTPTNFPISDYYPSEHGH